MVDPFATTREKFIVANNADFYAVLGVTDAEGWTEDQLASLYRRACREHHPDRHPGNQEHAQHFQRLQEAYAVVGNPQRRAVYDRWLSSGLTTLVSWSQWENHPIVSHWRDVPEPRMLEEAQRPKEMEGPSQAQWEVVCQQEESEQERLKKLFRTYKI